MNGCFQRHLRHRLTPYVESLITALPRRNEYVFASTRVLVMNEKNIARRERVSAAKGQAPPVGAILKTSATGYITEPNMAHTRACKTAGLEGLHPWYTPARYFARQLVKQDSTLLLKTLILADMVQKSLAKVGIHKRGGKKPFVADTILKAFSNVKLG